MNWLIYIGGGFFWLIVAITFYNVAYVKKNRNNVTLPLWLFFSVLIWVWVCWKFISTKGGV